MSVPHPLAHLNEPAGLTSADLEYLAAQHGIEDENGLLAACRSNRLRDDPQFGSARQSRIRAALARTPWRTNRRHLTHARDLAAVLLTGLQADPSAVRLGPVGAVRRMDPWVTEVELLASAYEPQDLLTRLAEQPAIAQVVQRTADRIDAHAQDGTHISLTVLAEDPADPGPYFAALLERTGPPAHVAALKQRAVAQGLTLDARGLASAEGPLPLAWEPDLYGALALPLHPPELRWRELHMPPPEDLLSMREVVGVAHLHTDARRGAAPVLGYARAALQAGFEWMLLADAHPDVALLEATRAAAHAVHADPDLPLRVLVGCEVALVSGPALCLAAGVVGAADVLFATIGTGDATARALQAARDPRVRVLAHPQMTARLDWDLVLEALADSGTALEISGKPNRLDLADVLRPALDAGVPLLPAADAHDLGSIDQLIAAVGQARRAAARVSEVVPTLSADAFLAWARTAPR